MSTLTGSLADISHDFLHALEQRPIMVGLSLLVTLSSSGPIVRIGPNRLALDGSVGWPQVFGRRAAPGQPEFHKFPDFLFPGDGIGIIGANTTETHRRQRRQLAHAFSEAAVVEQERTILKYIDLLILRLAAHAEARSRLDIVSWFNFTTFDIIGDLTFADSFHSLDNSGYHPWVASFFQGIEGNSLRRFTDEYPHLRRLMLFFMGGKTSKAAVEQQEFSVIKAKARMALGAEPKDGRRDFMTYMLRQDRDGNPGLSEYEILANCPTLIAAGSETTGSALCGLIFYLLGNPAAYKLLVDEVRSGFNDAKEITIKGAAKLEYLQACIDEGLRMYPPNAEAPPRVCPGAEIAGKYVPPGTLLTVYQYATYRNPENFVEPDSFRPQRWLQPSHPAYEAKYANDNRAACKPFSYGSRDCLGKNLAHSEMRLIMARILYQFDVELAPGQEDWHSVQKVHVIWSKGPLYVYLKPRK